LFEEFERDFGKLLQDFAAAGGVVAFPACEASLTFSLQRLFDVTWGMNDYRRSTWEPCAENRKNLNYTFGNGSLARRIIKPYNVKACTLCNVPPDERFFVAKESTEEVVVAAHNYGKGVIAYFADVNGEPETMWLVAAFVQSRAPRMPIDSSVSGIQEQAFQDAMKLKQQGNDAFQGGNMERAEGCYLAALAIFGEKIGTNGIQRNGLVSILSNLALIHLKKKEYTKTVSVATKALDIEWDHDKCSYRRAMALYQISLKKKPGGDIIRLRQAMKDILNGDHFLDATVNLMKKIETELARLERKQRAGFREGSCPASTLGTKRRFGGGQHSGLVRKTKK